MTESGGVLADRTARADERARARAEEAWRAVMVPPEPDVAPRTLYLDVLAIAQQAGGTPQEVLARADAYHEHLKEIEHG